MSKAEHELVPRKLFRKLCYLAVVTIVVVISCGEQREQVVVQGITFEAPTELDIREYTLDLDGGIFREGPSSFNQGVMISTDRNFFVEWAYAPEFTAELARVQAMMGPGFFDGTGVTTQTVGTPKVDTINGFSVTYVELELRRPEGQASGIIGVWQCEPSLRAINFIGIHSDPQGELKRVVSSFACS
jgi:hypothetical protein